jgi:hypothetical protein
MGSQARVHWDTFCELAFIAEWNVQNLNDYLCFAGKLECQYQDMSFSVWVAVPETLEYNILRTLTFLTNPTRQISRFQDRFSLETPKSGEPMVI